MTRNALVLFLGIFALGLGEPAFCVDPPILKLDPSNLGPMQVSGPLAGNIGTLTDFQGSQIYLKTRQLALGYSEIQAEFFAPLQSWRLGIGLLSKSATDIPITDSPSFGRPSLQSWSGDVYWTGYAMVAHPIGSIETGVRFMAYSHGITGITGSGFGVDLVAVSKIGTTKWGITLENILQSGLRWPNGRITPEWSWEPENYFAAFRAPGLKEVAAKFGYAILPPIWTSVGLKTSGSITEFNGGLAIELAPYSIQYVWTISSNDVIGQTQEISLRIAPLF
jgi:hypothetical protein